MKEKQNASSFFQSPATRFPLWTIPFHEREQEGIVVQKSPSGTTAREIKSTGLSLEMVPHLIHPLELADGAKEEEISKRAGGDSLTLGSSLSFHFAPTRQYDLL